MTEPAPAFEDSRRLTGHHPYFDGPGAALETLGPLPDEAELAAWRSALERMRARLGWPEGPVYLRRHARGATLAFGAPLDQLLSATEVNEWAWLTARRTRAIPVPAFHAPGHPAAWDEPAAVQTLQRFAAEERNPALLALAAAARARDLPLLIDDQRLSIGSGAARLDYPIRQLPMPDAVPWSRLGRLPAALVTGTNGKTTSVRLLAALLAADGRRVVHSCTDGLYLGRRRIESGDYSGPAGARALLRRDDVDAAVLESARGGILRRGLALDRADLALVTNVSEDHFGEYGIDDLDALGRVKLTVARAVPPPAWLVLNADDPWLRRAGIDQPCRRAWFSLGDQPLPESGTPVCQLREGRLWLGGQGPDIDLGAVTEMPLSAGGRARHNIANIAGAALSAWLLGVIPAQIAAVLARFGADAGDNPGRLQHWQLDGVEVIVDYAHNPAGLDSLLRLARSGSGQGRLGLMLGHAGNRSDAELEAVAATVARWRPERIVLKDTPAYLRGRAPGEVPALLRCFLRAHGIAAERIDEAADEPQAAARLMDWARPGDTVVLPVLQADARQALVADLERRRARGSEG